MKRKISSLKKIIQCYFVNFTLLLISYPCFSSERIKPPPITNAYQSFILEEVYKGDLTQVDPNNFDGINPYADQELDRKKLQKIVEEKLHTKFISQSDFTSLREVNLGGGP